MEIILCEHSFPDNADIFPCHLAVCIVMLPVHSLSF